MSDPDTEDLKFIPIRHDKETIKHRYRNNSSRKKRNLKKRSINNK